MNDDAREFFEQNPSEPYWYYSATLRVPNRRLKPWESDPRTPWPNDEEELNHVRNQVFS